MCCSFDKESCEKLKLLHVLFFPSLISILFVQLQLNIAFELSCERVVGIDTRHYSTIALP